LEFEAARKERAKQRQILADQHLEACKKILAEYKGPGGGTRYTFRDDAATARKIYMRAYATVWYRSAKGRALQRKRDKARKRRPRMSGKLGDFMRLLLLEEAVPCFYCERMLLVAERTIDHYVPTSKGGKHEASNLRIACGPCNSAKGDKLPGEFEKESEKCSGKSLS